MPLQHEVAQGKKIAQALGHFFAFDQQKSRMKPEPDKRLASECFGLCDLVFVMRENQVFTARVQIEALAQLSHGHDRALDVPAGTPPTDNRFPKSLARLGRFPERKVAGAVLIIVIDVYARAILHAREISLREFSVPGKFGDAEIIRSVLRPISKAFLLQPRDELRHLWRSEERRVGK